MDIEVTSDIENQLLGRREVECVFRGVYGGLSRADAVQAVSKKMKASGEKVYVISIEGGSGTRDAKGLFYIYGEEAAAKKDLPEYVLKRNAPPAAAEAQPEQSEPAEAPGKPEAEKKPEAETKEAEKKPEAEKPEAEAEAKPAAEPKEETKAEPEAEAPKAEAADSASEEKPKEASAAPEE